MSYSPTVNLGGNEGGKLGKATRSAYQKDARPMDNQTKPESLYVAFLTHTGAYDLRERLAIRDFYAAGCEFFRAGGELWRLHVDLGISGRDAVDNRRLFRAGYEDEREQKRKNDEQERKISACCPGAFTRNRRI